MSALPTIVSLSPLAITVIAYPPRTPGKDQTSSSSISAQKRCHFSRPGLAAVTLGDRLAGEQAFGASALARRCPSVDVATEQLLVLAEGRGASIAWR